MEQKREWRLLSTRNVLGGVLVAGIAAGLYLGDLFKGFGFGNSLGLGTGGKSNSSQESKQGTDEGAAKTVVQSKTTITPEPTRKPAKKQNNHHVVKIVIADRSYFVRSTEGDQATDLAELVELVNSATGDDDGIRVRIYRKPTSRTSTELALRDALLEAGVKEEQTVWVINPIDE